MAHPVRSRGFPLNCLYYSTSCPGCQALFWTFFIFFAPALRLPHLGAGALRPSCRPLRSSFQTPADAGSHLYPAQQDSVRSRTLSSRTYRLSWVLHPSPLRTFGLCLASLIYILIIPQDLQFVKHFFDFFC